MHKSNTYGGLNAGLGTLVTVHRLGSPKFRAKEGCLLTPGYWLTGFRNAEGRAEGGLWLCSKADGK